MLAFFPAFFRPDEIEGTFARLRARLSRSTAPAAPSNESPEPVP
jgi:hypothetical protein